MVEIRNLTKKRVPLKTLLELAERILKKEKREGKDLSVVFVGPQRMRRLNKMYRGKDYVTDVLSFSMKEFGLGEIILCPAKIRKDARKYGIVFEQELVRVFTH